MRQIKLLLLMMFAGLYANAQVTGTKTIPGDYATLDAAIIDLNTVGVGAGGATINLTTTETAPTGGYLLGSAVLNASTSAANPLVINGGNNLITAWPTGINTTSDAVLRVAGTDYVTLNQLNIVENATNTTTTTQMERGIALMSFSATDACKFVTIQNCTVNLNGTTSAAATETGIYISQQLYTAVATFLSNSTTPSNTAGVLDNIQIRANNIQNCYTGIAATSSSTTAAGLYSTNVVIGGTSPADGNTITGTGNSALATTAYGIYTYYVAGNYVSNNSISSATGIISTYYGIYDYYSGGTSVVSKNTLTFSSASPSSNTMYGIYHYYATSVATGSRCDSNTVQNVTIGGTGIFYGIYHYVPVAMVGGGFYYTRNNTVNNITRNGLSGTFYGIYSYSSISTVPLPDRKYLNNTLSNINMPTMGGSQTFYGLYFVSYHGGTCKGNTLTNVNVNNGASTTAQTFYLMYLYNYNGGATDYVVDSNEVSNVAVTNLSATIYSSYIYNGSSANKYYFTRNKFTNIGLNGGSSNANVEGMYVSTVSGPLYVMNNQISDLYATNGAVDNSIKGIDWTGGTAATNFLYNNTINLGSVSPVVSSGLNFGVAGVAFTVPVNMKNNIIRVNGTPNGTGYATAVRGIFTGTTGVVSANFGAGSGNNVLYVPGNPNCNLYSENLLNTVPLVSYNLTNDPNFNTSCGLFKSVAGARGASTFTEDNLNIVSAGVFAPSGSSYAESNAAVLPQVTVDFAGATRPAFPDCGASEFTGTLLDASAPTISYTPITSTSYCNALPTISASIADPSGVNTTVGTMPRIYFKKSTDANALVGNTSADNGWKYVEASNAVSPFQLSINPALLQSAPTIGDIIQYFVIAQDNFLTPNVGATTVGFPNCPSSVALTAASFPTNASPVINTMTIAAQVVPVLVTNANPANACLNGSSVLSVTDTIAGPQGTITGYCLPPTTGNTATYYVNNVTITGGATTINNTTGDAGVGGYADYYATQSVVAYPNTVLNFSSTNVGGSHGYSIYVDWDRDGVFNLTNEKVINTASYVVSFSSTFTVPPTASGVYRLRVAANELVSTNVEPCNTATNPTYGETEDYKLSIISTSGIPNSGFSWTGGVVVGNPNKTVTANNITASTIYTVTSTDGGGCTATSTVAVTIATPVIATGTTGTTTYCSATPSTNITLTTLNGSTPINSIWAGGPITTATTPVILCGGSQSGFASVYAPANWTTVQSNASGTINTAGAPANIVMTSSNNLSFTSGTTSYEITVPCTGNVTFNWSYTTVDDAQWDYPQYQINASTPVTFPGYNTAGTSTQSGTATIPVSGGDILKLQAYTVDNGSGACNITISNFVAPTTTTYNVVSGLTANLNPPVGTTIYTVTALDACGTTSTTTVSITVDPTPTVAIAPGAANVCVGATSTQVASGSGAAPVYTWMPGSLTGASQNLSPIANTTYTVTSTDGPCSATTLLAITSIPSPVFGATTATPAVLCPGDVTSLTTSATLTVGNAGPQAYNVSSIPYAPLSPITTTLANAGPSGDDAVISAALPFTFTFYGTPYTSVNIHTNGYLVFGPYTFGSHTPATIPTATQTNNWVGYWSDLNASAGQISWQVFGTAPNRYFVANYNNVPYYSACTPGYSGQTVLYENGTMDVHLSSTSSGCSYSSAVGTENIDGTIGTAAPGINNALVSVTNQSWRFNQFVSTPVTNYAWSDAVAGVIATPLVQTTNANPTAAYTYTVTATGANTCTATSTVSVTMKPTITGTASATPTSICLGSSTTLGGNVPLVCGGTETTFAGTYAPANWTVANINSNGLVNTVGAPASIILTSGTNSSFLEGYTNYQKVIDCAGTVSFNWAYSTPDIAFLDQPQYRVNSGTWSVMTGFSNVGAATQSGTQTITVAAGDTINIAAYTYDNDGLACTVTISNFSAPAAPVAGFVDFWDAATGGTMLGASPYSATPVSSGTATYYAQYNTSTLAGCTNPIRDVITVNVNPTPTVFALAGGPSAVCAGGSTSLAAFAPGGGTFAWSAGTTPSTGSPVSVNSPAATATYTVTVTDANTCTATSTIDIVVNPLPIMTSLMASPSAICANGTSTMTVAPGLAGGAYCLPTVSNSGATGDYISNFNFNLGAINNTTADGPGDYNDYSATLSAAVNAGSSYAVDITTGPTYAQGRAVYIDYNQDGDFDDIDELALTSASATGLSSGSITVPLTATNGTTRMRVICKYANVPTSTEACSISGFGEYEDYGIVISGGVPPSPTFATIDWSPATYLNVTNAATVTASAVMAATTYTVTGTDANGCSVTSSISLTITPAPTGNTQATAIAATLPYSGTGDNLATNCWTDAYTGLNNTPSPDVFYQFTMPSCKDSLVISTCAMTSFDSYLHLLDNMGTQIAFNDDACGVQSTINAGGLTPGATYYVVVEGYSSNTGTYSLDITSYQGAGLVTVTATATPNATTCENTSVTLTGGGATTYSWMPATVIDGQAFVASVGTNTYTVTGTDGAGCTATATIDVTGTTSSAELANAALGNISSTTGTSNQTQTQPDGTNLSYYDATCHLIAGVDDGAGGNVLGATMATVTVDATVQSYNGQPYVRRWYEITPTNNGPATVTLYLTQADFDDYNLANGSFPDLPTTGSNSDPNIPNIRITKVDGALGVGTPTVITPTMNWDAVNMRWSATFAVAGFSQFYFHSVNPGNVPLPATITNFSGRKMSNSDMLTWTTASEQNNAYFNLQYATDGINFKTIAKVNSQAANGNSSTILNYNYEHMTPSLGHNYYRLEQVDIDNHATINQQIVDLIWGSNGSTVSIYPNPTKDVLNIDLYTSKVQNTTVKVLDMSGRIIKQIQARSEAGMNQLSISLGDIASGIYTVQIFENDQLTQVSKVKKND